MEGEHLIRFEDVGWTHIGEGARQKAVTMRGSRVRLVELEDTFVEPDWCTAGHVVHVLAGTLTLEFRDGSLETLRSGESAVVVAGEDEAHKVCQRRGESARLFVVEEMPSGTTQPGASGREPW